MRLFLVLIIIFLSGCESLFFQEYNNTDTFKRNIMVFQKNTGNVGIGVQPDQRLEVARQKLAKK